MIDIFHFISKEAGRALIAMNSKPQKCFNTITVTLNAFCITAGQNGNEKIKYENLTSIKMLIEKYFGSVCKTSGDTPEQDSDKNWKKIKQLLEILVSC